MEKNTITADQDLDAQQHHLASIKYDLRISNLARFIMSKIGNSHRTLIDIGAGNGLFLKFFKEHGFEVTGVELEHENVVNMKKDPELTGISISQGDITQLTGTATYDVVIASDVIEHIEDDQKAVDHLWTYVSPGGVLVITVPAHSWLYGKRDEMWGHFRRYDKQMLKDRVIHLKDAQIETLTFWNTLGFFVYAVYEKILHKPINEKMRYSNSPVSRFVKTILDMKLRFEELIGGTPLGLTLVAVVKKKSLS